MREIALLFLLTAGAAPAPGPEAALTPVPEARIPHMRAGLWHGDVDIEGEKPLSSTYCDTGRVVVQPRQGACRRYGVRRRADGALESDSDCTDDAGVRWTIHALTWGDWNTDYSQDGRMVRAAPGHPDEVIVGHSHFRYVGACPKPPAAGAANPLG
ncbi:MAG TPA: hypothetical protein VGS12_12850 [Caulobacteraceae bacterium]|nr:hypothetical protein [Caulobacteraceae bacterium]